jgi:UDP-GlcNAc:undecaprenyl-phosphate GlcNAc-1-phosphate transferase
MDFVLGFFMALFVSILAMPFLMRYAGRFHLIDAPDVRKAHAGIVPRAGGIGIALSAAIPVLLWANHQMPLAGFLAGGSIIVLFGILDDRYNLDYRLKLLGQGAAALLLVSSGNAFTQLPLFGMDVVPAVIAYPATILFVLAATNAFNLLDGLDGLAGGCAILSLAAIAVLAATTVGGGDIVLIAVAVIGGILGFLRYNTHPAVIFMGDAGSQFLGFAIAALIIMLVEAPANAMGPAIMLPLLGLPILDTSMVMLLRIREGRSPFSADRNHIHHKLLSIGLKHHEAVGTIYAMQAVMVTTAYVLRFESDAMVLAIYVSLCLGCVGAYFIVRARGGQIAVPQPRQALAERTFISARWGARLHNAAVRYLEWSLAAFLILGAAFATATPPDIALIALLLAVILVVLAASGGAHISAATRVTAYLAVVYVSYLSVVAPQFEWLTQPQFSAWLLTVVVAIATVIVLTPRDQFQLSTLDLLIVLVVIGILGVPIPGIDQAVLGRVAFRSLVFLYACEVLLSYRTSRFGPVGMASVLALLVLASSLVTQFL